MSETDDTAATAYSAEDYELRLPPHLAPKLVTLLGQLAEADNPQDALWYGADDREDIEQMHDELADQLRDQGYTSYL